MKKILFTLLQTVMCLTFFNTSAQNVNLDNYTLDWSDEFSGLDSDFDDNWIAENATPTSTWMLCSRWRENVEIHDGILEITNLKEDRGGKEWTSGSVWTKDQFSYGYFEARYMYAAATGTNNSFWLWPRTKTYAEYDNYEIDINEGHYPNEIATNVHNWSDTWINADGNTQHYTDSKHYTMDGVALGNEYHIYGFEWTPYEMRWYFDGKLIRTAENTTNHGPTNIMFSLAILDLESFVGPVTDAIDGTSMKVGHVRYYKPKPGTADKLSTIEAPTSFAQNANVTAVVNFNTTASRDIRLNFKNSSGTLVGHQIKTVSGIGSVSFNIETDNPTIGTGYQLQAYMSPKGGDWSNKIGDAIVQNNMSITDPIDDNILSVSGPTSIVSNETINVTVDYSALIERDIKVNFKSSNGTLYGSQTKTVSVSGSSNFSFIADNPPVGTGYSLQAYMTPIGGAWSDRIGDLVQQSNITVTSASLKSIGDTFDDGKEAFASEITGIKFYPNPVKNNLYLTGIADGHYNVTICDMQGKLIKNLTVEVVNFCVKLNVPELAKGIYILKVENEEHNATVRFVKQ